MTGSSVISDLAVWGPHSKAAVCSLVDARRYCRALATSHYENFPVVSWLLPRKLHQHFYNVYAYCRWADDLGDETGDPARSTELLTWWADELDRCYRGVAVHPVFIALMDTIREFAIPKAPFADLIFAFLQDQQVHRYETMRQLEDYCRRSANPVGRIILCLCSRSTPENEELSDSICTGLQLANFWQDVARDYSIARVYLPQEIRDRFQFSDSALEAQKSTPEFQEMLRYLVQDARSRLMRGRALVPKLPGRIKLDMELFIRGGLLILQAIEKIDYRVWEQRPTVKKTQLLLAAVGAICGWK